MVEIHWVRVHSEWISVLILICLQVLPKVNTQTTSLPSAITTTVEHIFFKASPTNASKEHCTSVGTSGE